MQNKIKARVSTRAFSDMAPSDTALDTIRKVMLKPNPGLFGHNFNIRIIHHEFMVKNKVKRIGSYGIITGKPAFIFSVSSHKKYSLVDYGYCLENLVLELTGKGLDTVWLGGTFSRRQLKRLFHIKKQGNLPAVVAVGHRKSKSNMIQKMMNHNHQRHAFESIFFDRSLNTPLKPEDAGEFYEALEAVRLAPSDNNSQPWYVVKDRNKYHFYLHCKKTTDMKYLDIGIALSHFDSVRKDKGIEGVFEVLDNYRIPECEYVATFIARH